MADIVDEFLLECNKNISLYKIKNIKTKLIKEKKLPFNKGEFDKIVLVIYQCRGYFEPIIKY